MANENNFGKVEVLIVGGGPAGLSCAIQLKVIRPQIEICVIEKGAELGNHNLSGAVLEKEPIHTLLDAASPGWRDSDAAKDVLANKMTRPAPQVCSTAAGSSFCAKWKTTRGWP